MQKQKIIIIGGGIAELMTAIALNKKGISSVIYEKTKSFDANGAGLALWANATRILDKFGLLKNLLSLGNALDKMQTMTSNGSQLNVVNLRKLEHTFHFPSIVLLRSDLQKELLQTIPSSQIHFNKQCVKIENNKRTIDLRFSDGTSETPDAVIFADGIHSTARKDIFNLRPLKYAGRTSWRGIAECSEPTFTNNINYEIFGKGKRIGIFPLPNNMAYWYAAVNMTEDESMKQTRSRECVLSHFKGWTELANTVITNTKQDRLILTNINYTFEINKLVSENIALLGDAAHPMTPDLGQGACQAIEDAYVLADCLSQSSSIADGFKDYENKRLKRVKSIAKNSYRMGSMRQMENPIRLALRNSLFKILPERFFLKMLGGNIKTF